MERGIIFRGIRKDNGKWVYGDLVHHYSIKNGERTDHVSIGIDLDFYGVIPETVCQFTGLKDNNGVNIFEGDILYYRYDDELEADGYGEVYNEVVFKDGAFGIMGEITNEFLSFSCNPIKTEVVAGSIHDKHKQKQALIDMMRGDEEIGLYDDNTKNH